MSETKLLENISVNPRLVYRVWDCKHKKYLDKKDSSILPDGILLVRSTANDFQPVETYCLKPRYFVEPCIGICDRKDNFIYEHDIVSIRFKGRFHIVWNCMEMSFFGVRLGDKKGEVICLDADDLYYDSIVVGNIHDAKGRKRKRTSKKDK